MMSKAFKKRRLDLLRNLALMANCRHDVQLPLAQIAPSLDVKGFWGGPRFVDKENPCYRGGSDLAYDYNTLQEEGLIKQTYLDYDRDNCGGVIYKNPGIMVTPKGFDVLEDASRSWLNRAIEKQPMTLLQIIVTLIIAILTAVGGWAIGRYLTPADKDLTQTPTTERSTED